MADQQQDWEYGIQTEGHSDESDGSGPVILGENGFTYSVSGDNWGNLPDGWTYKEGTSVDVDSKDHVYVFNRGTCPMVVFDSEGNVLRTWGEGVFSNPHGVTIAPTTRSFASITGTAQSDNSPPKARCL